MRPTAAVIEVSSPGWAFWRAVLDTCIGLIVGTLYTFVGIIVIGIVGEEALSSLYVRVDLDPLFRASMGVFLLAAAVLAIVVPFVIVVERYAALRAVEAAARRHPDAVPQRSLRLELRDAPAALLRSTGTALFWSFVGIGGLCALAVLFAEDLREDAVMWVVLLGFVVLAAGAAAVRRLGRRWVERDAARMGEQRGRWRLVPAAVGADADRRDAAMRAVVPGWLAVPSARALARIANVLLTATFVSLAAFMISVFMRQQCRTCDPVYWDEPIENGIDVLSLTSGAAIALCAALGILAWTGGVVLQFARERALNRWVADGAPRRIDVSLVEPLLSGNRAMVRLQLGLSSVGAAGLMVGTGAVWAQWTGMDARTVLLVATTLIVLALVVGWTDAPRSRRERQLARDTLFPGDVGPIGDETPAAARKRRARRARR